MNLKNYKMEEKKLFVVEFGEAEIGYTSYCNCSQKPIFVVARDFNEAANKATLYVEYKKANKPPKKVLDSYGDLIKEKEEDIKIKTVKLAGEEVVW